MPTGRMVHLATVGQGFEAQLMLARLGAEGVLCQSQGSMGGPFPLSDIRILVDEDDLVRAREILALDDVVPAEGEVAGSPAPESRRLVVTLLVAGVIVLGVARTMGMHLV